MDYSNLEVHQEMCGDSRMMHESTFNELKESIATLGLLDKVHIWCDEEGNWVIVDGRHRYRAMLECDHELHHSYFERHSCDEEEMRKISLAWRIRKGSTKDRTKQEKRRDADNAVKQFHPEKSISWISRYTGLGRTTIRAAINRATSEVTEGVLNPLRTPPAESTTLAPESTNQVEIESTATVNPTDPQEMQPIIDQLFASSNPNTRKRYAKWVRDCYATPIGAEMLKRYQGWPMGDKFSHNHANKLIDLRLGWPNLGSDFATDRACRFNQAKHIKDLVSRVDDLDKINAANEGMSDYQQTQSSRKLWADMTQLNKPKPKPKPKQTNISDIKDHPSNKYPPMVWFSYRIEWWDIEGMDYKRAHCAAQIVSEIYDVMRSERMKDGGKMGDVDDRNCARHIRHTSDFYEGSFTDGAEGKKMRKIFTIMASAMDRNPGTFKQGDIHSKKYHTNER